jgi:hypothetical protein
MTAINWKTGQSGDWGNPGDWSGNPPRVPGSGDAVTIAASGNYTITISSAQAANSLLLNAGGAELLDTASLSIGTSFTETAGFVVLQAGSITGGKMSIASGAFLSSAGESSMGATFTSTGEIDVSAGTLALNTGGSIAGTLDGSGQLALYGGTFTAAGGATLAGTGYEQLTNNALMLATVTANGATSTAGSTVNFGIDAGGTLAIARNAVFLNTGTLTLGSTAGQGFISGPGTLSTTRVTNIADAGTNVSAATLSGTLTWQNTGVVDVYGYGSIGASSSDTVSILNQAGGGFYFTDDDGTLVAGNGGKEVFTNAGTLSKTGGTGVSSISMVVNSTGVLGASAGSTLALTGGGSIAGTVSGAGTVALKNLNYTLGAVGGAGTLWIDGSNSATETATAAISAGLIVSDTSTLTVAAGKTLTLSGPLTMGETTNVNGSQWGFISGPGTVTTTAATIVLDGGGSGQYEGFVGGNLTWINTGTVTVAGLLGVTPPNDTHGATVINQGIFDFAGDDGQLFQYQAATDSFTNSGTLAKISSLGNSTSTGTSTLGVAVISTGLITAAVGTLALSAGGSIAGTLSGAGTVQLYGSSFTLGAIAGTGTLDLSGADTRVSATETLTATIAPAVIVQDYGGLAVASGKSLTLGGSLTLGEAANLNGYQWGSISGPGTLTTTAATTVVDGGSANYEGFVGGNLTWINAATGTVKILGLASFTPPGDSAGASIVNQGNFAFAGDDAQLTQYQAETDSFTNTGTLAKLSGTGTSSLQAVVTSTGLISAAAGTLSLTDGGAIAGTVAGAGIVQLYASNFTLGAIAGAGTLDISGGDTRISATETLTATIAPAVIVQDYATLAVAAGDDLTLSGSLTIGETTNVNGYQWAQISGPGTLTTTAATTIVDGGNGGVAYEAFIGGNITWINTGTGTVTVAGQADFALGGGDDNAAIINQGNFDFVGVDAQLVVFQGGVTDSFTNTGTLAKLSGSNTTTFAAVINSTGLINVASGTLALASGGSLGGMLSGAGALALGGTFTTTGLAGAGHLAITGANTTLTQTGSGTIATALLDSGNGTLVVSAAAAILTLSGPVTLGDATGYGAFTGLGTIATTNTTSIYDGGASTTLELGLGLGVTWANASTVSDAGLIASGNGGSAITNSGTFNLTSNDGGLANYTGDSASFTNTGVLAKTGGSATSTIGLAVASTGTVTSSVGTLALESGATLSGNIGSTGNGVLLLAGGSPFTATGALAITDHAAQASVTVGNGVAFVNSGTISDAGILALGATNADSTSFTNSSGGTFLLVGADSGITSRGTAAIANAGLIEQTGGGLASLAGTITNSGTIDSNSGTLNLVNAVSGTGVEQIDAGATLEINTAATTQSIVFNGGAGATLKLDHPASRALTGFGAGDRLDLAGLAVSSASVSGTILTVKAGSSTYTFTSSALIGALPTFGTDTTGGSFVSLYRAAVATHAPEPLAFGNVHVGDKPVLALTVTNMALADGYSETLDAGLATSSAGFSASGTVTGIKPQKSDTSSLTVTLNAATAGAASGNATLTLASDGSGVDGRGATSLGTQLVALSGGVYAYAAGTLASSTINLGIIHANTAASAALTLTNGAPTGGYGESLDAGLGGASTSLSTAGSITLLAAGKTDTSTLQLTVNDATSGAYSGSATLGLVSDGAGTSGLGTTILTSQTVTVIATVDNYAVALLEDPSGPALTGTSTNETLNLGSAMLGGAALTASIGAVNAATGTSDLLGGTFASAGASGFTNSGLGSFSGLSAGQDEHAQSVSLATGTAGVFTETVVLSSYGTNASGYNGALATETLTIVGTITQAAATSTYTLALGPNIIHGADGAGDVFIAVAGAVNSRDQLTGGNGANSLNLVGAGLFDVNAPTVFSNIPAINATEGQSASGTLADTRQVVLMRDAATETLTVAAGKKATGNANAESITIYGGTGTDTIKLASGADVVNLGAGSATVTLGGATNRVVAGGGTALVHSTAAFAAAAVVGGSGSSTTLDITTGGNSTLNAADTYLSVKLEAATTLKLSAMQFISVTGSTGADSITAASTNQTLTGGLGADTLTGYAGGGDNFVDTAAGLNGDTIHTWATGDIIDLKDIIEANLHALSYSGNTSLGTLSVTDGTTASSIKFAGNFGLHSFTVVGADQGGGTLIQWHS